MNNAVFWSEHLRLLRESILAQIARIRKGSHHPSIKGTSIENVLRRLFEQYLPLRFSVATGQIAASNGEVSPQMDLMIYDRTTFPHLASHEDGSLVVCCESIYGCIEVKTRWSHDNIEKHFSGFTKIDAKRHPHFNVNSSEDAASYTVVLIERLDQFDWKWSTLKDQGRQVLVTSLEGDKVWVSEWGEGDFREIQSQNPLEDVFRELLRDCLRKKFIEINDFHKTYEAVTKYFGWSPDVHRLSRSENPYDFLSSLRCTYNRLTVRLRVLNKHPAAIHP